MPSLPAWVSWLKLMGWRGPFAPYNWTEKDCVKAAEAAANVAAQMTRARARFMGRPGRKLRRRSDPVKWIVNPGTYSGERVGAESPTGFEDGAQRGKTKPPPADRAAGLEQLSWDASREGLPPRLSLHDALL